MAAGEAWTVVSRRSPGGARLSWQQAKHGQLYPDVVRGGGGLLAAGEAWTVVSRRSPGGEGRGVFWQQAKHGQLYPDVVHGGGGGGGGSGSVYGCWRHPPHARDMASNLSMDRPVTFVSQYVVIICKTLSSVLYQPQESMAVFFPPSV